jgi:hypothetical protein
LLGLAHVAAGEVVEMPPADRHGCFAGGAVDRTGLRTADSDTVDAGLPFELVE